MICMWCKQPIGIYYAYDRAFGEMHLACCDQREDQKRIAAMADHDPESADSIRTQKPREDGR